MKFIAIFVVSFSLLISCDGNGLDMKSFSIGIENNNNDEYKNRLDLDKSSLIEQIRLENPKHYRLIKQIQNEIPPDRFTNLEEWLKTGHNLDSFYVSNIIKTSYPPKRKLFFMIDNIRYSITVTDQPYTLQGYLVEERLE